MPTKLCLLSNLLLPEGRVGTAWEYSWPKFLYQSLRKKLAPVSTITFFLSFPSPAYFSLPLNAKGKAVAVLHYASRCEGTARGAGSASIRNWELDGGE